MRKKNIEEFSAEDLRIVIGQNRSLPILIPRAIDVLERDILAEEDFYPGDLLGNVLSITPKFWSDYSELKTKLKDIFKRNQQKIKHSPDLSEKMKEKLFEKYRKFVAGTVEDDAIFSNYKPLRN